jgi:hypothetical protein
MSPLGGLRRPRQESNLHPALRRRVLYPLSYEGCREGYSARPPGLLTGRAVRKV